MSYYSSVNCKDCVLPRIMYNYDRNFLDVPIDEIPIKFYLLFSFTLFFLGILGIVFNRKNLINLMLSVELMLFGASLNFIFFSMYWGVYSGYIFALLIITVAAADSAIGLGIFIASFYVKRSIAFESFSSLKG